MKLNQTATSLVDALARRPTAVLGRGYRDARNHESAFAALLEALGDVRGRRLVELGCGGGVLAERILRAGAASIVGVDHSPHMLAMAADRNAAEMARRRLVLHLADARTLGVPDASIDAVYNSSMFFFLDDPDAVLRECARILRPGGRYVMTTLGGPLPAPSARQWWLRGPMREALHTYTDTALHALLTGAGFASVDIDRRPNGPVDLQVVSAVVRTGSTA